LVEEDVDVSTVKVSIRIHYSNTDRLPGDWVYKDDQLIFSLHWVLDRESTVNSMMKKIITPIV
jgi:hypothetical protein